MHLLKTVMEFRVLGPLVVHAAGRAVAFGASKQRMLLALLLLRANETVSFDHVVDTLWRENPPSSARNALQVYVSRLRKALPPGRITTTRGGYSLVVQPDELDLDRFRARVQDGRRARAEGDASLASECFSEALRLWRGPPLSEFIGHPVFEAEIVRLEEERLSVLEDRSEIDLELGRHSEVVPELESLVARNPRRERLVAQLMLALYRCGRQAEALETYRAARHRLVEELGLEPGPFLSELHQRVLVQDPSLELPRLETRPAPTHPSRRRVTLLLAGLSLPERLDPEVAAHVLSRGRKAVHDVLSRHEAVVEEPLGDVVLGAFGLPAAHEDDALRALRAAVELSEALAPSELSVRMAIDTGEVLASDDRLLDDQVAGWMMRLKEGAGDGDVVIGEGARRLVRGAVTVRETEIAGAWKVLGFDPAAEPLERRFDVPLIGRDAEIERLREALSWVVGTRSCHLLTILGPAGIGKSRLARELSAIASDDATILVGRCLAYGSGAFWPLAEVVRQAAGDTTRAALDRLLEGEDDARLVVDQLTAALGTSEKSNAEDAFWAFRKLFGALARERPLALVLEDFHWGEQRLHDLVEELVERGKDSPILVVCLARPELLEQRPSWGGGRLDAESIRLEPLSEASSEALISLLEQDVPDGARRRIVERAEGNPLFIEQMVALLAEDPQVAEEGVPPSIQAVLAARLALLESDERDLLERASVVGLEFSLGEVVDLSPEAERSGIPEVERRLVRKELVRPAGSEFHGDRFRFRHILIRDVVYDSVLKSTRAELHERLARRLEEGADDRSGEVEEIIGYHLERAYELRRELDPEDAVLPLLAVEAGERLAAVGRRELDRSSMSAAIDLLMRALRLLPEARAPRGQVLAGLAYAFRLTGQWELARQHLDDGFAFAARCGDQALKAYLTVSGLQLRLHTEPDFTVDEFLREGSRALRSLEALGSNEYAARVRGILAWPYALRGQSRRAESLIETLGREQIAGKKLLPSLWLCGPLPVHEAIARCEALLAEQPPPRTAASCFRCLAILHAMQRQFEDARGLLAEDQAILEELGFRVIAAGASSVAASVELMAGDPVAAERILRAAMKKLDELGQTMHSSSIATLLARALFEQAKEDEAWSMTELAGAGPHHDVAEAVDWREIRSKLLAGRGQVLEAERLAQEAVDIARTTDSPDLQGDALTGLAEVLLPRKPTEAREELQAAAALYEQKGNLVSAARARSLLDG